MAFTFEMNKSRQKLAAVFIWTSGLAQLANLIFLRLVNGVAGITDSTVFYISHALVAAVLGVCVYLGFRIAWAIATVVYSLLVYVGMSSLLDLNWSGFEGSWRNSGSIAFLVVKFALYVAAVVCLLLTSQKKDAKSVAPQIVN